MTAEAHLKAFLAEDNNMLEVKQDHKDPREVDLSEVQDDMDDENEKSMGAGDEDHLESDMSHLEEEMNEN